MITSTASSGSRCWSAPLRHRLAHFNAEGTGSALATVITLATLTPGAAARSPPATPGREFSPAQLAFAAVASLVLYAMFVFTQTVRHRDFFLPVASDEHGGRRARTTTHDGARRPADAPRRAGSASALLLVALVAVVGLAKVESPADRGRRDGGRASRTSFVGVVIALLVLLPETIAAVRAARRDRVQISLNLAYGSAMASIGLTIPAIAVASIWLDGPLVLGLEPTQMVLLLLSVIVCGAHRRARPGEVAAGRPLHLALLGGVPVRRQLGRAPAASVELGPAACRPSRTAQRRACGPASRSGSAGTAVARRWMFCSRPMASMPANIERAAVRHERQRVRR